MKHRFPGLCREKARGRIIWRVRVEFQVNKKITIPVPPEDKNFSEYYHAARQGIRLQPKKKESHTRHSFGWLVAIYLTDFERKVSTGSASIKTLKKKKQIFSKLTTVHAKKQAIIPRHILIRMRDSMIDTPAAANDMITAIRVLYEWAIERGYVQENTAKNIKKIDQNKGGTTPWSLQDLQQFKRYHGRGTMAHTAITLLTFTACRIGDARLLGRQHEITRDGIRFLAWDPEKKNASAVEIPIMPQLASVLDALPYPRERYLLTQNGRPFSTADSLSHIFKKWCAQAGLPHLSAHGVRKAVGTILAESGCSQYEIMAIHGHTESKTSEIYTRGADRRELTKQATKALKDLEW